MRDINRLGILYQKLQAYHYKHPDLRFCQIMTNFMIWLKNTYGIEDVYYIEDSKFIKYFDEFVNAMNRG